MVQKIDEQQVRHIAHLGRLKLTDAEIETFGAQLSDILDYVEQLNELDTEGVEPTAHAVAVRNVMAPDAPREPLPRDRALANAPQQQDGFFKVPKVLDTGPSA